MDLFKNKWIKYIINFPVLPPLKIDSSDLYFSCCIPADGGFTCPSDSHTVCLWNSYNSNLFQNSLKWGTGLEGLKRSLPASNILSCERPDAQWVQISTNTLILLETDAFVPVAGSDLFYLWKRIVDEWAAVFPGTVAHGVIFTIL